MDAVATALQTRLEVERRDIVLSTAAPHIFSGLMRDHLSPAGHEICELVERADLLVVGSPVYRASYTGIIKHLFDLVDRSAMHGCKAVISATGGTALHGLMLDHQLRPLMSFFGIQTFATALYGLEDDFDGERLVGPVLQGRIALAADEAVAAMRVAPAAYAGLAAV